jgi:hypothetical protein
MVQRKYYITCFYKKSTTKRQNHFDGYKDEKIEHSLLDYPDKKIMQDEDEHGNAYSKF